MRLLVRNIALFAALFIGAVSCEDGELNIDQRDDIVDFLEGSHSPKLIPESSVGSAIEDNPPFYTTYGSFAFRYISTFYDENRDDKEVIKSGDTVTIYFDIYPFSGRAIDDVNDLPSFSNRPSDQLRYEGAGLNTEYWDFTPLTLTIGEGGVLSSIHEGLVDCRVDDEVYIYMTYNMAYGDRIIGLIEKESELRIRCNVLSVD